MDRERCERALELVWTARVSDAPDTPEVAEARRHLADCPPCRDYLRRDGELAARLRDIKLCRATPCPEAVREAVDREIRAADTSWMGRLSARRRRWPSWVEGLVASAAAIVLIGGGLFLSHRLDAGLPDEAFTADFRRTALPEIVRQNVSRAEVEAFYRAQFGDAPSFVLDAPVTKVAMCNLEGRMGALIEYDWSGQRLVYYQVPRAESAPEQDLRMGEDGELSVARWGDANYDYALISAMPGEDLASLARRART